MTWAEFKAQVRALIDVDNTRQGAQTLIDQKIWLTTLEVQRLIPFYASGHSNTLIADQFTTYGYASLGSLPERGAVVTDATIFRTDEEGNRMEHPCVPFPWSERMELVWGRVQLADNNGRLCIDPARYQFYAYPRILSNNTEDDGHVYTYTLILQWDGRKDQFEDSDETPFDAPLADAVADEVKAVMAQRRDDLPMFREYRREYLRKRAVLYADTHGKIRPWRKAAYRTATELASDTVLLADPQGNLLTDPQGNFLAPP